MSNDSEGSRRKRRAGLRVPSDEVPRRVDTEVSAPIPEAAGLAASVSESFGVSEPESAPVSEELPTLLSDGENAALAAAATPDGESIDIGFDDPDENTDTSPTPGLMGANASVTDLDAEATIADEAPVVAVVSRTRKPKKPRFQRALTMALSDSDLEEVRLEDGSRVSLRGAGMLGQSGVDKSGGEFEPPPGKPAAEPAAPEVRARADSGDLLDDSELEEVEEETEEVGEKEEVEETEEAESLDTDPDRGETSATPEPRAEIREPPPPPSSKVPQTPKAKVPDTPKAKAPDTPKAKAPAPPSSPKPKVEVSAEMSSARRRGRKPWFEEIFDEDYLRTLPFLTPQATKFEANFVMESLGTSPGAQLLDVGCGYGRHAMELAARGYHMVGLDGSLPLLLRGADEAQRRGLNINFVHGDMREMSFESQFDGAYCLFSSFGYFDDETNKRTAQNIAKALKPGARFVVEVLNRDYLVADLPSRVWWEGDGCVVLEEVEFNYFSSRIVSNRSVVFDDGRQLEHEISLRSFSLHELGKFLHAVGFRVLEISGSMSTRGRFFGAHSRDIVVVAERRASQADES